MQCKVAQYYLAYMPFALLTAIVLHLASFSESFAASNGLEMGGSSFVPQGITPVHFHAGHTGNCAVEKEGGSHSGAHL